MRVDVSSLSQGPNRLELVSDAEALDLVGSAVHLIAPVTAALVLTVLGDDITIEGVVRSEAEEECSRCLATFRRRVEVELRLYAVPQGSKRAAALGEDGQEDSEGFLVHDGHRLDLREEVRSAILLAAPMQPLCSPDCRGLCHVCGQNLNDGQCSCPQRPVDPRWKGLEKLKGQ